MKVGDVLPTKTLRVVHPGGWADFKPPKGEQFVVVLLGSEPVDGSNPLDPIAVFHALGWQEEKPPAKKARKAQPDKTPPPHGDAK
jgi:hypothetical protein